MRWPSIQVGDQPVQASFLFLEVGGALDQPARDGEDERHGHVGGVLGEDARRVGDSDAAVAGRVEVDVVDAGAEVGDEAKLRAGLGNHGAIDAVRDGGDQHVGDFQGFGDLALRQGRVIDVEPGVEQLAHAGLDDIGQLARDNDDRLCGRCSASGVAVASCVVGRSGGGQDGLCFSFRQV